MRSVGANSAGSSLSAAGCISPTTIIIPTFNRPEMLRECLDALQKQTILAQEIIIVNDGGEASYFNDLPDTGVPLRVLHQENAGKSVAVNAAVKLAQGDFIWIVDDDDIVLPMALATLTDLLSASPEAGFAYGRHDRFVVRPDGTRDVFDTGYWCNTPPDQFLLATLEDFFAHQTGMLIRRTALNEVGAFDEKLFRSLDYEMSLRLARSFRPVSTQEVVFLQRQHSGQRGPNSDPIPAASMATKWIECDQAIFQRLRQEWALELFVASRSLRTIEEHRTALIQRGVVMARKKLWREALEDWKCCAALANGAISQDDARLLRRALHGKYGCDEAYRDRCISRALQEFAREKRHLQIVRALASGLARPVKSELQQGNIKKGVQAAYLMAALVFQWLLAPSRADTKFRFRG